MNQNQLTMTRGDTREFDLSDIADADGQAFNLAGATVKLKVEDLFTITSADDIDVDESSGDIVATVEADATEDAPDWRRTYRYEVEVTTAAGTVHTARRGLFVVVPDVQP